MIKFITNLKIILYSVIILGFVVAIIFYNLTTTDIVILSVITLSLLIFTYNIFRNQFNKVIRSKTLITINKINNNSTTIYFNDDIVINLECKDELIIIKFNDVEIMRDIGLALTKLMNNSDRRIYEFEIVYFSIKDNISDIDIINTIVKRLYTKYER